jgi:pimeloyl-ACP methyl ester carboxylesterase
VDRRAARCDHGHVASHIGLEQDSHPAQSGRTSRGLRRRGGLSSAGFTKHGWPSKPHSPSKNAMCRRRDTLEVARYLGKYGSTGTRKAVIISGVPPFLLKTPDNPEGLDGSVFEGIQKAVAADRYAFFTEFFKNFYNTDVLMGKRVSEQAVQASWNVAAASSASATFECVSTWHSDFREDVARIDVPTLVMHGDTDRILPITAAGLRTAKLIKGAHLVVVEGGPHCITWTYSEIVNRELLAFLGEGIAAKQKAAATR